ncbi:MAG: hypothetical protein IKJ68_00125 [Clostridia bacterium]|nr:hypothetical protein [Clostridia bacterium]
MYGHFINNTAGYEVSTLELPTSWEYIYENGDILLKMDQFGPVYAQANPPGDIMLFKREQHQKYSPWTVSIKLPQTNECFSNFVKPCKTDITPENLSIKFLPECAVYSFEYRELKFETEIFIPCKGTAIVYKIKVKNNGNTKTELELCPQMVPYLNDAVIAPWDKYEWYLDSECINDNYLKFRTKLLSADAIAEKRRCAFYVTQKENCTSHELSLEKYIGYGDIYSPNGNYTNTERLYAYPPVYASKHNYALEAGEEIVLTQVFTVGEEFKLESFFDSSVYEEEKRMRKKFFEDLFSKNSVHTGDEEFDNYVNYWLPAQMNWVASLDRGWPTGMRGSRDSAQDYAAFLYTNTEKPRDIILMMMQCQRDDGWFPRQYSAKGKHGKHDLRGHVDGGVFFVELVWKYLAHTGDYDILNEEITWLNTNSKSLGLDHLIAAVEYYLKPENTGEHGLCKIYEGDWLDAVNKAGLEGRGESVTVSEQLYMSLKYLADILTKLGKNEKTNYYLDYAEELKKNINKYALNGSGYYNALFNDDGKWIFSDNDPDGEKRMYGVSNYYAVISGVADKERYSDILNVADYLKCDEGYRLFFPYLGEKPIEKVGRIASGDAPPFMGENGNVYNHGSQGFLARALACMDEGDRLFDTLKWLMPYDTSKHPTQKVFTPPYAIVNCYQHLPGFEHRGLMCFLTGSVAMAMRGVYEWMFGIRPTLDGLEISPCLPENMKDVSVTVLYKGKKLSIEIKDKDNIYCNGEKLTQKVKSFMYNKDVCFIEE